MTVATYSTAWGHTNTTNFRAWGSALSAGIQGCGLSQTADTGQINWTTVTYTATANYSSGYEIYQFTDTLQATYPIFIKIEYGTGAQTGTTTGEPAIWITVGEGSNGSGTLTGTLSNRTQIVGAGTANQIESNTLPYPTYICFNGSYLGIVHKAGGLGWPGNGYVNNGGIFMIGRGTNTSGAYVGGEIVFICSVINNNNNPQATIQCINTVAGTLYTNTTGTFTCAWFTPSSTTVNGLNFQLYPCWSIFNQVEPINWLLYGLNAEIGAYTTVTATPFGSTQHTYLMTGQSSYGWGVNASTAYSILMLWE